MRGVNGIMSKLKVDSHWKVNTNSKWICEAQLITVNKNISLLLQKKKMIICQCDILFHFQWCVMSCCANVCAVCCVLFVVCCVMWCVMCLIKAIYKHNKMRWLKRKYPQKREMYFAIWVWIILATATAEHTKMTRLPMLQSLHCLRIGNVNSIV